MRDRLNEFGDDTTIALITFTDPTSAEAYATRHDLPFPVLVDPNRDAFRAYGLGRGSLRHIYGWRTIRRYWQVYRKDGLGDLHKATEDTLQLGGNFIIDPAGKLNYGYWSTGPADRPSVDELLQHLPKPGS